MPIRYSPEEDYSENIDLRGGGMGLEGPYEKRANPEIKETRESIYEMQFSGVNIDEIIEQVKNVMKETGKIASSYKIDKMDENGITITFTFEDNRKIDHSSSKWGFPEMTEGQAA